MKIVGEECCRFYGNVDYRGNGIRLEKLEEMQGSIVTEGCLRN